MRGGSGLPSRAFIFDRRNPGDARGYGQKASPKAAMASTLVCVLCGLDTYVSGQSELIIDYARARGSG